MTEQQWETVDVPRGAYVSWGTTPGQSITGTVTAYDPSGGTDFGGAPCPQLQLDLLAPGFSVNKEGQRTDFAAGDAVVVNCGLVSLKRAVRAANPAPGDAVRITFTQIVKVDKGTVKEFGIQIARGGGAPSQPAAARPAPATSTAGAGGWAGNALPPF